MAFYDWYHWFPNVDRDGKPQDVLIALSKEMAAKEINVSYWQLDAYWYDLEIAPGYCIVDWHAVADQFPKGLAWLKEQLGAPLLLYTDTWCQDNKYRKEQGGKYEFMNGKPMHLSWFKGNTSNVGCKIESLSRHPPPDALGGGTRLTAVARSGATGTRSAAAPPVTRTSSRVLVIRAARGRSEIRNCV